MAPDRRPRASHAARRALHSLLGLLLVALATAVTAGIVAMHGFTAGHQIPFGEHTEHVHTSTGHEMWQGAADEDCPVPDRDGHDSMAVMCMFMLLWLVVALPRRRGSPWWWQPPWLIELTGRPAPAPDHLSYVSLIRLCISRT